MSCSLLLVFCNTPVDEAPILAGRLVDEGLAACVNILPRVTSVYRWKGRIEVEQESTLLIKTTIDIYPRLERRIEELHSYDLPEIIAVQPEAVLDRYLTFVENNCQ